MSRRQSAEDGAAPENRPVAATAAPAAMAQAAAACPFQTRNWRVTLDPGAGSGGRMITIRGEVNADALGRYPLLNQQLPQPPEIFLSVDVDPAATPQPPPGWADMGVGYDYDPVYTYAVVRCAGREIARMPIPPG